MDPMSILKEAIQKLEAMCEEFKGHDLPYGSKAYMEANTFLNEHKLIVVESNDSDPYLLKYEIECKHSWNPNYPEDEICNCGHPYYRHFDTYENMATVGCKYCDCYLHTKAADPEKAIVDEKIREEAYLSDGVVINELLGHVNDLHGDARLNYYPDELEE